MELEENAGIEARLAAIACSAQWLSERCAAVAAMRPPILRSGKAPEDEVSKQRAARWRSLLGDSRSTTSALDQRLALAGCSTEVLAAILNETAVPGPMSAPWIDFLRCTLRERFDDAPEATAIDTAPIPFQELVAPFLLEAVHRLEEKLRQERLATDRALYAGLIARLRADLAHLIGPALQVHFANYRRRHFRAVAAEVRSTEKSALYQAFISYCRAEKLLTLFSDYPVIARLCAQISVQWVATSSELLRHIHNDRHVIGLLAKSNGAFPGRIRSIEPTLSDAHDGGKTVCRIVFESGPEIICKPRTGDMERAYNAFLRLLNRLQPPFDFRLTKIVCRQGYSWAEYIPHRACGTQQEVHDFHRRVGALLAVAYLLEGTDFHFENMIASGEWPVLVDTETLFHARPELIAEGSGALRSVALSYEALFSTVLRTHLLPRWEITAAGASFDISALGASKAQVSPEKTGTWSHINTDAMSYAMTAGRMQPGANLPGAGGPAADPSPQVIEGFASTYEFLREHRHALIDSAVFQRLQRCRSRYLFRDTRLYARLLQRILHPKYLRSGIDFSLELEMLWRSAVGVEGSPAMGRLVASEIERLQNIDIPKFECNPLTAEVYAGDRQVLAQDAGVFSRTPAAVVRANLEDMNPADRERQISFIGAAYASHSLLSVHAAQQAYSEAPKHSARNSSGDLQSAALAKAIEIAHELKSAAHVAPDGAAWLAYKFNFRAQRYQLAPLDFGLYDGAIGLAIFFAALGHVTRDTAWTDIARQTCQPLRQDIRVRGRAARYGRRLGIGLAEGLGSLVYGLTVLSDLLADPALLQEADTLARELSAALDSAHSFDLLSGSAGAVLSLAGIGRIGGDHRHLETAARQARILATRMLGENGGATPVFSGMAHGKAGLLLALERIEAATGAIEPLVSQVRAMVPICADDTNAGSLSWCYGWTGQLHFSAAQAPAAADTTQLLDAAIARLARGEFPQFDHVCCGTAGILDALILCTTRMPASSPAVQRAIEQCLRRILDRDTPTVPLLQGRAARFSPGFFQGLSGIGYTLLRAVDTRLPSICAFELGRPARSERLSARPHT